MIDGHRETWPIRGTRFRSRLRRRCYEATGEAPAPGRSGRLRPGVDSRGEPGRAVPGRGAGTCALLARFLSRLTKVASGSYRSGMRSVGLKVLKNRLSEYIRLAAGGETVLVTDRDRVVAEIVPPQAGRSPFLADVLLAEAVREGWLTPAVLAGGSPPPRRPIMAFRDLMKELRHDREDR
jgi:antitoxin (DNA-binding transcriptional repressor) of toxin-antitoxin stability system